MLMLAMCVAAAAASSASSPPPACQFADDGHSELSVSCGGGAARLTLSRANGGLTGLYSSAGRLSAGSRAGCLFGASGPAGAYCGNCGCGASPVTFAWSWRNGTGGAGDDGGALRMTFTTPSGGAGADFAVTVTARPDAAAARGVGGVFDLQLAVLRPPAAAGAVYSSLLWPSELLLDAGAGADALSRVLLPLSPGVALLPPFFTQASPAAWSYPDSFSFANWWQADLSSNGSLAVYDLSGPDDIVPQQSGLYPAGAGYSASTWYAVASLPINLTTACDPLNAGANPCAVGMRGNITRRLVLSAMPESPLASIRAYTHDNGMLPGGGGSWPAPPFPTIRAKLAQASGPDWWRQVFAAPLMKLDATGVGMPFSAYASRILPALPPPTLLHVCGFSRCGADNVSAFDCNYPDIMPPATTLGSSCDMQAMMLEAAAQGHLTMPYSNPTWWDVNSPTMRALIARTGSIQSASSLNASLQPNMETYNDYPVPRSGVANCPTAPFVIDTISALMPTLSWNTSAGRSPTPCEDATAGLPSSFVFEDQVGARFPKIDFSPFARGMGALSYAQGLQAHAAAHAGVGLHTEQGYDRMARAVMGFHGTVLLDLPIAGGAAKPQWAPGAWTALPLFAASGLRAVVMQHQHNLANLAMACDMSRLCASLALGTHLSLDIGNAKSLANVSWIATVAALQRVVASRFADFDAVAFSVAADDASRTATFASTQPPLDPSYSPNYTTTWASDGGSPTTVRARGHALSTLADGGCAAAGSAGDAAGGFYIATYNGQPLALGIHVIVEGARACARMLRRNRAQLRACPPYLTASNHRALQRRRDLLNPVKLARGERLPVAPVRCRHGADGHAPAAPRLCYNWRLRNVVCWRHHRRCALIDCRRRGDIQCRRSLSRRRGELFRHHCHHLNHATLQYLPHHAAARMSRARSASRGSARCSQAASPPPSGCARSSRRVRRELPPPAAASRM